MALREAKERAGYSSNDRERFLDEPAKRKGRTEFARDRARIIHSFALRRLAAKTQVAVPWASDFPRTRLSHSLECAQVGRELGEALGADPDLMEGACLAHDLGHPPFGHNGESALAKLAEGCGGFEGNAQSFRLLTRIEAKTVDEEGISVGLNLTRASLDAATKYPWSSRENSKKFGVYSDDEEIFEWVREGAPSERASMEAQIMDWSDDVAYSVHDLEDALVTGHIKLENLERDLPKLFKVAKAEYLDDVTEAEAASALKSLQSLSCWPKEFDRSHRQLAQLKDLTSQLIGRFALSAERETRAHFGSENLTRYQANLLVPRPQRVEVAMLKAMPGYYIILAEQSQELYAKQRVLLAELVSLVLERAPGSLESFFLQEWYRANNDSEKLRVVIDQVASLTDPGAYALHRELTGKNLED
ncbi:MAG: deoxyguanosinetriphosphate triphosphohydrolase [Actinobacteria bacterium]|jgi:dGTPase|nr:deoxyguanosinetriphosphate triphosphohydrolase [Actinomycetota bacterium]NCX35535.1 deoxyguanosinetriphosphate triphosphohydrolase [Actinomycetota bacterium]NDA39037.1 deoxyguanosinetriphosphate triphosphohydrolase [Actinomycetota bacterium]NDE12658.1 deoxyguanosinetriphosphate triphosphohydrolase [Actinomycetota bacterium]NDE83988.1 deoxyguanosinetriphosphate triphosphohydrolase [Actinomycetota bacterium]